MGVEKAREWTKHWYKELAIWKKIDKAITYEELIYFTQVLLDKLAEPDESDDNIFNRNNSVGL